MRKLLCAIGICLATVSSWCQSTAKYQVGTITCVKPHQTATDGSDDVISYDVCVKVEDTIYVVLYTPPLKERTVRYATGRELLVLVGKKTIAYNDILGNSQDVPILSSKSSAGAKQSK